jgi:hypothetical protein
LDSIRFSVIPGEIKNPRKAGFFVIDLERPYGQNVVVFYESHEMAKKNAMMFQEENREFRTYFDYDGRPYSW